MLHCDAPECFGATTREYRALCEFLYECQALRWLREREPFMFPEYVQETFVRLRAALHRTKAEILEGGAMALAALDSETPNLLVRICRGDLNGGEHDKILKTLLPYLIRLLRNARNDIFTEELRQYGIDVRHQRYEERKRKAKEKLRRMDGAPEDGGCSADDFDGSTFDVDDLREGDDEHDYLFDDGDDAGGECFFPPLATDPWRDFDDEDEFQVWLAALKKQYPLCAQAVQLARKGYGDAEAAKIARCSVETFWKRKSLGCQLIARWAERERNRKFPPPESGM